MCRPRDAAAAHRSEKPGAVRRRREGRGHAADREYCLVIRFLGFASLLRLLSTAPLRAQAYPIMEIKVAGSQVYSPEEVIAYTGLKVDKKVDVPLTRVEDAARKLAQSGVFQTVDYKHLQA